MFSNARVVLLACLLIGLSTAPALVAGSTVNHTGVTSQPVDDAGPVVSVGFEPAQKTSGRIGAAPQPIHATVDVPQQDDDWELVDTVTAHVRVPPGERYEIYFDHDQQRLREVPLPDNLTFTGYMAVERAPDWLKEPLTDNFGRLGPATQDTLAQLILDAKDPWVDEVAFQVARMAPASLKHELFNPDLITENARLIYEHDPVLQYVDVVDYGSAAEGGDYYSTTRYRVTDGEGTTWVEIPNEMYYWFVVQPKLSDETVKMSAESDSRQATYGYFWRYYLFANPDDTFDYARGGHPVLGDVLKVPTTLWDLERVNLPGGRPFEANDVALDVIGNWVSKVVPRKAISNRPVQPNQICYEHNGNCGELQDLLGAAARTGLIPTVLIADHCEDHVWNEFYWLTPEDDWHAYQVDWDGGPTRIDNSGVAYDKDVGGGKDVSGVWAWRGDGYTYDVIDRYSNASDLVVRVGDGYGKPVDGARVLIYSEAWGSETDFFPTTWGYTNSRGEARFRLGDHQNYYLRVTSALGSYPPYENQITKIIVDSAADGTYTKPVVLSGILPRYDYEASPPEGDAYQLRIRFDAPHEIIYGQNVFSSEGADFAQWEAPGVVDLFALDAANYGLYQDGATFSAAVAEEDTSSGEVALSLPGARTDWHVMFSNEDHKVNKQVLDAEITLYRQPSAQVAIFLPLTARQAELRGVED